MPRAAANGIELEYETFGSPSDPPLLLVMGFTAQMTSWDDGLCRRLADGGHRVIRFDNRDVGLSTKLDGVQFDIRGALTALMTGSPCPPVPYTLSDMAADAFGLLDALGIETAHVVGASMGGMIVQTMAIEHPERVLTMTSIMSNTGEREYGQPRGEAVQALLTAVPTERAEYVEHAVTVAKIIGSPRFTDGSTIRARAAAAYDRSFYPEGSARQLGAIVSAPPRADGLRALSVPTLVIHGRADPLIQLSGGERTAELVPGASLLVANDMGHDLPEPLWPLVTAAIGAHTHHPVR
jgi:pimeloyl-ACP methyl ester carboxylesterase